MKQHPEIKVVANQAADWDATKAHAVTSTVLKQNPDLCAIIGFWDVRVGTAAAIKEAGKRAGLSADPGRRQAGRLRQPRQRQLHPDVVADAPGQARDMATSIK